MKAKAKIEYDRHRGLYLDVSLTPETDYEEEYLKQKLEKWGRLDRIKPYTSTVIIKKRKKN